MHRFAESCRKAELFALAASFFGFVGNVDAQAEALVQVGEVEQVEAILDQHAQRQRQERAEVNLSQSIADLRAAGQRRLALSKAQRAKRNGPEFAFDCRGTKKSTLSRTDG